MSEGRRKIDVDGLRARIGLVEVVQRYVKLRKRGAAEWEGLCPFHDEKTPSFTVNEVKGFVHCFGCGAHHDVIGFVMAITGRSFLEACEQLGAGGDLGAARNEPRRAIEDLDDAGKWVPISPVPTDVPELMASGGWTVPLFNPKSGRVSRWKPARVDAYRDAESQLLGHVLRLDLPPKNGRTAGKWTPQVTWCVGPQGRKQWCLQSFLDPRPLCGLDDLAAMPEAPVLMVEGEKCRAAGAGASSQYAVLTWPGGSNGLARVDWSPLANRDVVLWPDADEPGRRAMLGHCNDAGDIRAGVAQYAARAGARSLRYINTEGRPKGWDIADALLVDGWTWPQLAAWAAARVFDVHVQRV